MVPCVFSFFFEGLLCLVSIVDTCFGLTTIKKSSARLLACDGIGLAALGLVMVLTVWLHPGDLNMKRPLKEASSVPRFI